MKLLLIISTLFIITSCTSYKKRTKTPENFNNFALAKIKEIMILTPKISTKSNNNYLGFRKRTVASDNSCSNFNDCLQKAKKGFAEAQFDLGRIYYNGYEGVTKDYEKTFYWFELSAKQGHVNAQLSLGLLYHLGKGVTKNHRKAYKWLLIYNPSFNETDVYDIIEYQKEHLTEEEITQIQQEVSTFKPQKQNNFKN